MSEASSPAGSEIVELSKSRSFFCSEDWLAIAFGSTLLLVGFLSVWFSRPNAEATQPKLVALKEVKAALKELSKNEAGLSKEELKEKQQSLSKQQKKIEGEIAPTPLKSWVVKIGSWTNSPTTAFASSGKSIIPGLIATGLGLGILYTFGLFWTGQKPGSFAIAFVVLFGMATLSFLLGGQKLLEQANLEYPLWALIVGLLVSNTVGTPEWLKPAMRTELFIKTGLLLLGGEVLFNKLLALGGPGIFVSWVVTPIVLISTYLFGQYVLKMQSRSLNLVISADMSVCGVSAAIATAAACKAKKEELSLAIGLSLGFTVLMMIVMPKAIQGMGLSDVVGGAWIGGTIDSTGAVAAAGEMLDSKVALEVATTVKMIQNILIGIVALGVAIYWSTCVENRDDTVDSSARPAVRNQVRIGVIWERFPKFVLGFVAASILFSWLQSMGTEGQLLASGTIDGFTKNLRVWLFCLGFVSIGLDSNLREFMKLMSGGKPLILYVVGQTFSLILSLFMCWLMFEVVFKSTTEALSR